MIIKQIYDIELHKKYCSYSVKIADIIEKDYEGYDYNKISERCYFIVSWYLTGGFKKVVNDRLILAIIPTYVISPSIEDIY